MKGLIIKDPWITKILNGEKVWEIRGSRTSIRGRIGLIKSGSGKIFGSVKLIDCVELPREDIKYFNESWDKHRVVHMNDIKYKKIYAWVLEDPLYYPHPIGYQHPQGAVIWVNL